MGFSGYPRKTKKDPDSKGSKLEDRVGGVPKVFKESLGLACACQQLLDKTRLLQASGLQGF